jgi:hypothetical protein
LLHEEGFEDGARVLVLHEIIEDAQQRLLELRAGRSRSCG